MDNPTLDYKWPNCTKKIWPMDDDIVISGIGGRFPESDNIDELAENLLQNIDMVTRDERRWPIGLNNNQASRSGKLKNLDHFDNTYFCTIPILSDIMEPGSRIILETTYEAIADAGISPQQIRGTKTGVYVGINTVANAEAIPQDDFSDIRTKDAAFWVYGSSKALLANRISFLFDFTGPSTVIDTACSASLVALTNAVQDLRTGNCDMAVVATSNICLAPYSSYVYHSLGLLSDDGKCKVFDKNADGFVRSETVGSLFLMRHSMAKRIYATILHAKTNTDGFKTIGLFAPFWLRQRNLMIETFQEAGIKPEEIDYFESHGTGTNVGDPQETKAVSEAYCQNRKDKLLVGAVKSNLGHTEGASGICSVAKAIIIFEYGTIPANLHYNQPKPEIECLHKTVEPVVKNMPFNGKIIGVNSFGVGGVNAHALLKINQKGLSQDSYKIIDPIPRLINVCGRTEEAVEFIFNFIKNNPQKIHQDFLTLLNDSMKTTFIKGSANFPYRGYLIIKKNDDKEFEYIPQIDMAKHDHQLWLVFTGMGSQWAGMGKQLMKIETFAKSITNSAQVLKPYGIDLLQLVLNDHVDVSNERTVNSFVAITSMQLALFDVFKILNLPINGIIGHSFGEIACAYADGCLTAEQAILTSYWRGKTVEDAKELLPRGLMAAVGMMPEEIEKLSPEEVYIACYNGNDSVTISGLYEPMSKFIAKLKSENVFVRKVAGGEFPYHSIQMKKVVPQLLEKLNTVITEPKKRSSKWIATSVSVEESDDENAQYASGQYFVNNLQRPVYFEEGMRQIPKKSCCIEMAPHSLFNSIFKRCYKEYNYISLMKKDEPDNLIYFLSSLGKIYTFGFNPSIENLYPKVHWPVARGTQSISSLIKWDHSRKHEVKKYPDHHNFSTASNYLLKISILDSDWRFLKDHIINGKCVFPLTGYLMIVWRAMATKVGQPWHKVAIQFENIRICRPTFMNESNPVNFVVQIIDINGKFVLSENNNLVCKGNVFVPNLQENFLQAQHEITDNYIEMNDSLKLNNKEIYKELRIRGYDYGPMFQGLIEADGQGNKGIVQWTGHWISFVDSVLHLSLLSIPVRTLFVPIQLDSFKCDPIILFESIHKLKENRIDVLNKHQQQQQQQQQMKTEFYYFRNIAHENEIIPNEEVRNIADSDDTIPLEIINFTFESEAIETEKKVTFDVKFDFFNQLLVTKGIEIKGLVPINVPRKIDNANLVLERHQFVPFHEELQDFHENSNYLISDYIKVCTKLTKQLLSNYSKNLNSSNQEHYNNIEEPFKKFSTLVNEHFKYLDVFKKIYEKQKEVEILNQEVLKKIIYSGEIEQDILHDGIFYKESFTRPILELFSENLQHSTMVKILEICPNDQLLAIPMIKFIKMNVIHKFEINYLVTKHETLRMPTNELKTIDWILEEGLQFLDLFINEFDLVILRANSKTLHLWEQENAFKAIANVIKPSGFILHISSQRESYVFEKILDNIAGSNMISEWNNAKRCCLDESIDKYLCSNKQFWTIASKFNKELQTKLTLYRKSCLIVNENIHTIFIDSLFDQYSWIKMLQDRIGQLKENNNQNSRIWIISNCDYHSGILGFANCIRLEQPYGSKIRIVAIFDQDIDECLKNFDIQSELVQQIISKDLAFNIYSEKKWGTYRFISIPEEEFLATTENAYVTQTRFGDLSSIHWVESEHKFFIEQTSPKELVCNVYYSALNFKDVIIASGKIMPGPESFLFDCNIGLEYSGRRNDTGERIMGMVPFKGISTTVLTHKDFVWTVPDEWSLEDAATVPIIYVTAYYALLMRGQLKENDSVLIHSGAGGVGQAALNICQYFHCEIFVTVGNDQKREFIRTKFNINDDHILSSRNTQFEKKIKILTKGRGVDIVLNSLSGDKLLASLRCLATNGRFLEIGKYDMQMNTTLGMFSFLKNISFHGIGLDSLFCQGLDSKSFRDFFKDITKLINDGINNGIVRPIDRTVFQIDKIEDAFRYMMNGKHIGKVLIQIRQEEIPFTPKAHSKPLFIQALIRTWFSPYKFYIIAGGLGGVGLELIYWMILHGARRFVITSRSGIKSSYQRVFLERFKVIEDFCSDYKIEFHISTRNIANSNECLTLIEETLLLGKIGGIFNLAMVLEDGMFENQTMEIFEKVCKPKLNGLMNLDQIVRRKKIEIDYFVAFSSFSSGRGNAGQTNYGYANSAMERIIENRNKNGLPGLVIQFGPINDVGVLVDNFINIDDNGEETLQSLLGLSMQRIYSCLEVLDRILARGSGIYSSYIKYAYDSNKTRTDDEVIRQLCAHLNIDKRPEDECLGDIGLDSMAAVEIQQRLECDFNISLSLADVRKITVKELKNFRDGNRHNLKQYSDDIKKAKTNLSRLRFVIPTLQVVALNPVQEGKPIYCLPSLIGIFDLISVLAQKINRPVFGLNWTRQLNPFESLKQIIYYYYELIIKLASGDPDGTYDILVLDFGALLAALMCKSKIIGKQLKIKRLTCIDLLPISTMDQQHMIDEKMLSDYKVILIFDYIRLYIPERICDQSQKEVLELNCERARVEKIAELLRKCVGTSIQGNDMAEIIENTYHRASLMVQYQMKLFCKSKRTIRRMVLDALYRNEQLKIDYIKLMDKNEQTITSEKRLKILLDLNEEYEQKFSNQYRLHIIKGTQEEMFGKLLDENSIQMILNQTF